MSPKQKLQDSNNCLSFHHLATATTAFPSTIWLQQQLPFLPPSGYSNNCLSFPHLDTATTAFPSPIWLQQQMPFLPPSDYSNKCLSFPHLASRHPGEREG
jgi:hypothetical protein